MRILLDDAAMDTAATKLGNVQGSLEAVQGRLTTGLSAGAPPAIKGQVEAAVAEARATAGAVAKRCSSRSIDLRRRAILTRIADGDYRAADLVMLRAINASSPFVNARVGNGTDLGGGGGGPFVLASMPNPLQSLQNALENSLIFGGPKKLVDGAIKDPIGAAQTALDVLGLFPGLGEPMDGINGLIYLAKGDKLNAAISFAALLPVIGSGGTLTRLGGNVLESADEIGGGAARAGESAAEARQRIKKARKNKISGKGERHVLIGTRKWIPKREGGGRWQFDGGHKHPGQPGKNLFPQDWTDGQILDSIADIMSRPNLVPKETLDRTIRYEEIHNGVLIRVIVRPNGQLVTAYPPNGPLSPLRPPPAPGGP